MPRDTDQLNNSLWGRSQVSCLVFFHSQICECVCGVCMCWVCMPKHMWRSEDNFFFFLTVCSGAWAQVTRPEAKRLCPLSHLTCPTSFLLEVLVIEARALLLLGKHYC